MAGCKTTPCCYNREKYKDLEEELFSQEKFMETYAVSDYATLATFNPGSSYYAYDGKGIIPGSYKWLGNFGATYHPPEDATFNLVCRYRSKQIDPVMKAGGTAQTNHIGSYVTVRYCSILQHHQKPKLHGQSHRFGIQLIR